MYAKPIEDSKFAPPTAILIRGKCFRIILARHKLGIVCSNVLVNATRSYCSQSFDSKTTLRKDGAKSSAALIESPHRSTSRPHMGHFRTSLSYFVQSEKRCP